MNGYTVLIIDDEPKIIDVVKAFLETKGYEVYGAKNTKEAFAVLENKNISIILLDLMLPDMTGEEFCLELRNSSAVPIIMLTAKVAEEDMLRGLQIGADDYITKPFSLKALLARIEAVLRRSSDVAVYKANILNSGDLAIDFNKHEVYKAKAPVNVTPNEFKLLSSMMKYPNKVFTRDELIEMTFGQDFTGYERTIDSHIKNLRKKIETDPKNPVYIKTVHGVGYTFGGR